MSTTAEDRSLGHMLCTSSGTSQACGANLSPRPADAARLFRHRSGELATRCQVELPEDLAEVIVH
jgi:hypothetical protein